MATETAIDTLKSLVYGRGRGAGIKIVPKNYAGEISTQVGALAQDVMTLQKIPPDTEDATVQQHAAELACVLECRADSNVIAGALTRYVLARVEWTGRGAVE